MSPPALIVKFSQKKPSPVVCKAANEKYMIQVDTIRT